ncbi:hypothetical protein D3C87_84390 [compost metagenome]
MSFKLLLIFLVITFNVFAQKINISLTDTSCLKPLDYSEIYQTINDPLQCQLKDSVKNGHYHIFYVGKRHQLALEGLVENYKKEGAWTTYYKNGGVAAIRNYKNGKLNGAAVEYDLTGALIFEGNYVDNKKEGLARTYFTFQYNGGRSSRYGDFGTCTYSKDLRHGPADFWKNDSTVHITCNYKNNSMDGQVVYKNQFDQLLHTETYENGSYIDTKKFANQSYETTYDFNQYILFNDSTTSEQIREYLQKIDSCRNVHSLFLFNYSTSKNTDSLIQLHLAGLSNLSSLTSIRLRGHGFYKIPAALFQCVSLQKLILEQTSISELPEETLNFKGLHSLEINGGNFKDINTLIKTIAQLRSLKELEFANLTKGVPENIHLLNQIEALYFVHNNTTIKREEFPIHSDFFRMKNLKVISLPTNFIYDQKFMALFEKKMPKCLFSVDEW